jgi:integrase/recombinase XerD
MANACKFLDKRFKLADGTFRVRIRITHERRSIYLTTKYSFDEDSYNKKIIAGKNINNNEKLLSAKREIENLEKKAISVINGLDVFTFDEFKSRFEQKGDRSNLVSLLSDYSRNLHEEGKFSNANIFVYASTLFKKYALYRFGSEVFPIKSVTPKELQNFQKWASSKIVDIDPSKAKRAYSLTTISMYLVRVQKVFNDLIRSQEISSVQYPFGKGLYQIPQSRNNKRALSLEEIMLLVHYNPTSKIEDFAKSMFIFSYLCSGMNMADIFNLKHSDIKNDRIIFIRQKTKGKGKIKELSIRITPDIKNIIDKHSEKRTDSEYLFGIFSSKMTELERYRAKDVAISRINRSLKLIASKIGLPTSISTYFARHSYATIQMEHGAPTEYISQRLGHSNLETTRAYLSQFSEIKETEFEANLLFRN